MIKNRTSKTFFLLDYPIRILLCCYSLLERPAAYQDNNQILFKNALKDSDLEPELKAVARMDLEIQRALKFLQISTDLRQLQKRPDVISFHSSKS